jgi:hypothetical protein
MAAATKGGKPPLPLSAIASKALFAMSEPATPRNQMMFLHGSVETSPRSQQRLHMVNQYMVLAPSMETIQVEACPRVIAAPQVAGLPGMTPSLLAVHPSSPRLVAASPRHPIAWNGAPPW